MSTDIERTQQQRPESPMVTLILQRHERMYVGYVQLHQEEHQRKHQANTSKGYTPGIATPITIITPFTTKVTAPY